MNITSVLEEINASTSTTYKVNVLKKYKDSALLRTVLKMAYDKVAYTYGVRPSAVPPIEACHGSTITLDEGLSILTDLSERVYTGNAAINKLTRTMEVMSDQDREIILKILDRDLKIGIGRTMINKVFSGLIIKPPYMRCNVFSEKTAKHIKYPAIIQMKADSQYRHVIVDDGGVTFQSRSGEESEYPLMQEEFEQLPSGTYVGELLVRGVNDRQTSNGLINSKTPPHSDLYMVLWDYIQPVEWSDAKHTNKNIKRTPYHERLKFLQSVIPEEGTHYLQVIPSFTVNNIKEALEITTKFMRDGYEGCVLKDRNNVFKDHTSPTQLKLKIAFSVDVRITGFTPGKARTSRELTFGSLMFETDDGQIKGACSGLTDAQIEEIHANRESWLGRIIEVTANDLTKARDSDYYALSHPRFTVERQDKTSTDTLEQAIAALESAKTVEVSYY